MDAPPKSSLHLYSHTDQEETNLGIFCQDWGYLPIQEVDPLLKKNAFFFYDTEGPRWTSGLLVQGAPGAWDILYLYVKEAYRGQGKARDLLFFMTRFLTEKDPGASLFLEVRPSNHRAIQIYEAFGLKKISIRKSYYSNGEDAWVYLGNSSP